MRVLVVYAHPVEESFCAALHRKALEALSRAGHEVRDLDLYAMDFQPVLTRQERIDYDDAALNTRNIEEHVAHIRWAEALLFVYPTWWYGLPAILKGWLDRVWVPEVTFHMPVGNQPIRPAMTHIRKIGGISTYGAPWWWTRVVGDPGRRTLLRGIKPLCHKKCRTLWLAHYKMDSSTPVSRAAFLEKVERAVERF